MGSTTPYDPCEVKYGYSGQITCFIHICKGVCVCTHLCLSFMYLRDVYAVACGRGDIGVNMNTQMGACMNQWGGVSIREIGINSSLCTGGEHCGRLYACARACTHTYDWGLNNQRV